MLADQDRYLASESTFYRVLKEANQQHRRGRSHAPHKHASPTTHRACTANQVWSWDITYLPSPVRGQYYYLYLIEDIYSRKAVGWEVYEQESGERAAELMERTVLAERCAGCPLVLHSDNGAPMGRYWAGLAHMGSSAQTDNPAVRTMAGARSSHRPKS